MANDCHDKSDRHDESLSQAKDESESCDENQSYASDEKKVTPISSYMRSESALYRASVICSFRR